MANYWTEFNTITTVVTDDGETAQANLSINAWPEITTSQFTDKTYKVVSGDSLDTIAYRFYATSRLWWAIALANQKKNALDLTPGETLIIPAYTTIQAL